MWRYVAGGGAALAAIAAGIAAWSGHGTPTAAVLPQQPASSAAAAPDTPLPDAAPKASDRTREQKRFDRYDKDRDGSVTRTEYLAQRHKAFAKLDTNGDGQLSFDEWAAKAEAKFAAADVDKSGAMTRAEFATTAVKRKSARPVHCPPPAERTPAPADEEN